jgi:GNAT superfamily N-acetyltransferase
MPQQAAPCVALVRTAAEHRAFWTLPYQLHRATRGWVAPLRRDERRRWDPRHNPTLLTRQVWRFVAWRAGKPVGRVAAVLDPEFARRWAPETGLFGFFECPDHPETASALLQAAESTLRSEGVRRVMGPVNLSFHDEMGLLVRGFEEPPALLSPNNPPYYPLLIEGQGYRGRFDQHAYRWSPESAWNPAVERAVRLAARGGIIVRSFRPAQWEHELRTLHALYNSAFIDVWGFVPIEWEDFRLRAESFRPFYRPELVLIAELHGRPVGFVLALPDPSALLARINGRLWPLGAVYLGLRTRSLRQGRCMLLGVLPTFAARGIAVALLAELIASARRLGIGGGELSLVHEDNRAVRHLIASFGNIRTKTFRVYEKVLG